MNATAADYTWFTGDRFSDLAKAYCFTLVRGLTPEELVARLGARAEGFPRMTLDELIKASYSGPGTYGTWDDMFFGAVAVGDWVLIVQPNGLLGITDEIIVPLSAGTRLVSHFRNVNAVTYFYWVENGEIRLFFEPFPFDLQDIPDDVLEIKRQTGFDLGEDGGNDLYEAAAFALAEHLTGVKVTPQLLEESTYLCGVAPEPR